jgi:hypothetical protein
MFNYAIKSRGNFDDFKRQMEEENHELCLVAEQFEEELTKAKDPIFRIYIENRLCEIYSRIKTEDEIIGLWRGY